MLGRLYGKTVFCTGAPGTRARPFAACGLTENPRTFQSGELKIDFDRRAVFVRGARTRLTPKEFELLQLLVANKGRPLRHRTLLQTIWGPNSCDERQYLRVFISQLRKKIEPNFRRPSFICTDPWVGYRFELDQ